VKFDDPDTGPQTVKAVGSKRAAVCESGSDRIECCSTHQFSIKISG
jgi:hypothetical protein